MKSNRGSLLIGLSGGVDSSVAAWLLKEEGWSVTAVTMSIYDGSIPVPQSERSGCFGPRDALNAEAARRIAKRIGIPHLHLNLAEAYRKNVLDYFRSEYLSGRTPNPCIQCNRLMKFGLLRDEARRQGIAFERFATGHYARVSWNADTRRHQISRGKDPAKDQSYFLSHLSQEQLADLILPLGNYRKEEIREIASKLGWSDLLDRSESQDFIACDDYSPLFKERECPPGNFINQEGKVLGRHRGIIHYTIGQRRGIGIGGGIPFYVLKIDSQTHTVTLGGKEELYARELTANQLNWVALPEAPEAPLRVEAQIRQRHQAAPAELIRLDTDASAVKVRFESPQMSVTPGQIVAFYDGPTVLGAAPSQRAIRAGLRHPLEN